MPAGTGQSREPRWTDVPTRVFRRHRLRPVDRAEYRCLGIEGVEFLKHLLGAPGLVERVVDQSNLHGPPLPRRAVSIGDVLVAQPARQSSAAILRGFILYPHVSASLWL